MKLGVWHQANGGQWYVEKFHSPLTHRTWYEWVATTTHRPDRTFKRGRTRFAFMARLRAIAALREMRGKK